MSTQTFTIKTSHFEGPFDLLLFFIERDELDINDIPISKITDDFLDYIHQLESLDIDVASEFILVAATLMRIKAKLLLPRKELDQEGNEIDPREDLAQKLIEYKRYKEVIEEMQSNEALRSKLHERGNTATELKEIATKALVDIELESLTLFKLLQTFKKVMERHDLVKNRTVHEIVRYNYTVEDQSEYIINRVRVKGKTSFQQIFKKMRNRIEAIVTFLALLELLNLQQVSIVQGEGMNNFWIDAIKTEESE